MFLAELVTQGNGENETYDRSSDNIRTHQKHKSCQMRDIREKVVENRNITAQKTTKIDSLIDKVNHLGVKLR